MNTDRIPKQLSEGNLIRVDRRSSAVPGFQAFLASILAITRLAKTPEHQ
jgi:hypothetical protein